MKIVQIGCSGHYGSMLEALEEDKQLKFIAFAPGDKSEECGKLKKHLAEKYNILFFDSYLEMLDKTQPDIAIVNSHFNLNSQISCEVLGRGIDCYAEKPSATTLEELEALKRVYYSGSAQYASMLEMRCIPEILAAKSAVKSGLAGEILMINVQKSYKLGERSDFYRCRQTYGGTIPWVGIHAIDLAGWISEIEMTPVYAFHSTKGNKGHGELEAYALMSFRLANGGCVSVNVDYFRPQGVSTHGDDRIRVVGTDGIVEVMANRAVLINNDGEKQLHARGTINPFKSFIEQIRGINSCYVSAEDSFKACELSIKARELADAGINSLLE